MSLIEKLGKSFVITTELGPVKGTLFQESLDKAKDYLFLDGINVHDCPMGNLRINAISMASLIQRDLSLEAIPHFTCRDRSLLGTQADLLGAHALGIRYVLVTTGDPPKHGPYPSKPVYDYNTLELMQLIKKMNSGVDYNDKEFGGNTDFRIASTALPTARDLDRELKKMEKKIQNEKIIGYALLSVGVIMILVSVYLMFNVFTGARSPPSLVHFSDISIPILSPEQKEIVSLVSGEVLDKLVAMGFWYMFMFLVMWAGGKIASLGVSLIRETIVEVKETKPA